MKPWLFAFILSLSMAMFWGFLARFVGAPLWFTVGIAITAFLSGWFAYGMCVASGKEVEK